MKLEMISRNIKKTWKKIGALLGFAEEELNVINKKFLHNPSLEMLWQLKIRIDADEFTTIVDALESSKGNAIPAEILARGPDALEVYQAALEEGESDINLVRLMVMGPENVGKTCLINSLLGKEFIEEHIITEVMAMTTTLTCDNADNTKWTEKKIDHKVEIKDKQENAVASKTAEELQKIKALSSPKYADVFAVEKRKRSETDTSTNDGTSKATASASPMEDSQPERIDASVIEKIVPVMKGESIKDNSLRIWDYGGQLISHSIHRATASASSVEDSQRKRIDDSVIEKIVQVMKGKSIKDNSLRIWDYGGQLIYHSIHRLMVTCHVCSSEGLVSVTGSNLYMTPESIFVIVFKIADDLDAYVNVIDSSGKEHQHYLTNLEYLLYFIRSAYTYSKDDDRCTDEEIDFPVCIIVGTHLNSLTGSEEEIRKQIEEKFAKIRKAIESQVYKSHVHPKYFAVENKLSSSDGEFIKLKKFILEMKEKMDRLIPLKWLDLLKAIHKLSEGQVTLPLEQVKSMARQYLISDETIDYAIKYLSDVGEIMYHSTEEALTDIVVIKPMDIVEYVRPVFTIVKPEDQAAKLKDDWQKLEKGVLTKRLLKHLWKKFPIFQQDKDEEMFQFFVNLMKKFGLICQKRKQNNHSDGIEYYALSHIPPEQYSEDPIFDQGNDKVSIFHDFCGFLPDYLFHLAVTKFIEEFEMENGRDTELAYEHAVLTIDIRHYVRIAVATINHHRMFKTTVVRRQEPNASCVKEPAPETCEKVLSFLESVLRNLCFSARGIEYKMCIRCSEKCQRMHYVKHLNKDEVPCGKQIISIKRYFRLFV
ncbi:uncharacterized protein LOC117107047, partial [Anneissia japonica]|uniref:uncharacterized protein LOC117107047 n=1 Tax=Anneissia japonica TaxID=1529436 RepID=UPI0014257230